MPVEIRELVVRLVLDEKKSQNALDSNELIKLKNNIIKECTEKVLRKLETISER